MVEIPEDKVPPRLIDPLVSTFYGAPKIGKTTMLAGLPESLALDFEILQGGSEMIAMRKMGIIGLKRYSWEGLETAAQVAERHKNSHYYLSEVITALRTRNQTKPKIKFGVADTITRFEEMCAIDATDVYMKSAQGHLWNRWSDKDEEKGIIDPQTNKPCIKGQLKPRSQWELVTKMGMGYGYPWLWDSIEKWLNHLIPLFEHTILVGHLRLKLQDGKNAKVDTEVSQKDIELSGKVKNIVVGKISSVIGYIYRQGNKNVISFQPTDEVVCGSRAPHLADKHIVISEKLDDGTIKTYWHEIFKSLAS
jgi:hypothetical protein